MPARVGIDLMPVNEVEESLRVHADRYLDRVFTPRELADCRTQEGVSAVRLAARLAAKEAAIKVLRPSGTAVPWRSIEVERVPEGGVGLRLTDEAAALAETQGLSALELSLSHQRGLAAAVVVAEMLPTR